jgi:ferredoxin
VGRNLKRAHDFVPDPEQMKLWPAVSGNTINGVGESEARRPSPIYWHAPDATPHGPLQKWFYARTANAGESVAEARRERQRAIDEPLEEISPNRVSQSPEDFSRAMKSFALTHANAVGVAAMQAEWVFEGFEIPNYEWLVVLGVQQDFEAMQTAPSEKSLTEITLQYARGTRAAKAVANWIRKQGYDALPYGGPMAGSFVLIPAAIEAGLGELGKHGSLIHRELGANFRLASVLTNAPFLPDKPDVFGADDFCTHCRLCADACPPDAILPDKQLVRGEMRWYVDFDKCLPYFNEHLSCAACLPACPFSRPEMGKRLVEKLALKKNR